MRLLITGASGFIGRNLSKFAVDQGHEVTGTYLSRDELHAPGVETLDIRWEQLQIQDASQVAKLVEDLRPEGVLHLAAQAYAQKAWNDPPDTFRTNVLGTIYLYEALRKRPPKSGVLLSASGSEYGVPLDFRFPRTFLSIRRIHMEYPRPAKRCCLFNMP